jgi:hypothetical protein
MPDERDALPCVAERRIRQPPPRAAKAGAGSPWRTRRHYFMKNGDTVAGWIRRRISRFIRR